MRARDNPFATERLQQIPFRFPDGLEWPSFLERLEQNKYRGALVGLEGSGKTTLLEQLKPVLTQRGFVTIWMRLDRENCALDREFWMNFFREITARHIILFDGAEQLNGRDWQRFVRCSEPAGGLIITTHRPGRLFTVMECLTSLALFKAIVAELLGSFEVIDHLPLGAIYEKTSGNLRQALLELYDQFASD